MAVREPVRLIRIGYWRPAEPVSATAPVEARPDAVVAADDGWPDPRAFIDEDWDEDEREAVSDYLSAGFMFRASLGIARCGICGRPNGSREYTDGVYAWPEGLAHYVDIHAVRLPERFVRHVVGQFDAWDEAVIDEEWWRSLV